MFWTVSPIAVNLRTVTILAGIVPLLVVRRTTCFGFERSYPKSEATFVGIEVSEVPVSKATSRFAEVVPVDTCNFKR